MGWMDWIYPGGVRNRAPYGSKNHHKKSMEKKDPHLVSWYATVLLKISDLDWLFDDEAEVVGVPGKSKCLLPSAR